MNTEQKVEVANQRIKELQLLIRYWEASKESSEHVALELVVGGASEDYEAKAA